MPAQDDLANPAAGASAMTGSESPSWWESRSSGELQAIVHRGVQGGDMFFAAVGEMERRARNADSARSAQEKQASEAAELRRRKISLTLLAVALTALAVMRILDFF
jgi:hypothetical protein